MASLLRAEVLDLPALALPAGRKSGGQTAKDPGGRRAEDPACAEQVAETAYKRRQSASLLRAHGDLVMTRALGEEVVSLLLSVAALGRKLLACGGAVDQRSAGVPEREHLLTCPHWSRLWAGTGLLPAPPSRVRRGPRVPYGRIVIHL